MSPQQNQVEQDFARDPIIVPVARVVPVGVAAEPAVAHGRQPPVEPAHHVFVFVAHLFFAPFFLGERLAQGSSHPARRVHMSGKYSTKA